MAGLSAGAASAVGGEPGSVTNAVLSDIRGFFRTAREGAEPELPAFVPEAAEEETPTTLPAIANSRMR